MRSKTEAVVLRLECDGALSGFGESTPRLYVTGEDIETVSYVIREVMAESLLGQSVSSLVDIEKLLTDLASTCEKKYGRPFNSALGAVDLALLDALGKHLATPAQEYLGPALRECLPYALSIPLLPINEIRSLSPMLRTVPTSSFKVVVGTDRADALNRLRFVRDELEFQGDMTLDANGILTADEAIVLLDQVMPFEIAGVEQPTAKDDLAGLRRIRKTTGIPLIADESMCTLSDAQMLIEEEACDIFNIKISKCGGLLRSKEIALFAHEQGIPCQIGAHVGETEILSAAGKALARTVPDLLRYDGFSSLLFPRHDECVEDNDGEGTPPDVECTAGLGLGKIPEHDLIEIWSSGPTR